MTPYDIYNILKQLGQINDVRRCYREVSDSKRLVVSMQSSDIVELRRQCESAAEENSFKVDFTELIDDNYASSIDSNASDSEAKGDSASGVDQSSPSKNIDGVAEFMSKLHLLPDEKSPANILNALNDDCLRTIIESPALNLWDLTSCANVCKRFNAIALQVFTSKYADTPIILKDVKLWRVEELFSTFGPLITSIQSWYTFNSPTDIVHRLTLEHCNNLTKLYCETNYKETVEAMRTILPRLQELHLRDTTKEFFNLFESDTNYALDTLRVRFDECSLPSFRLPHLTKLILLGVGFRTASNSKQDQLSSSKGFFAQNPQLELLTLSLIDIIGGTDQIFQHLPNLTALDIEGVTLGNPLCFSHLKQLKKLRLLLENPNEILKVLLDAGVCLEHLSLNETEAEDYIDTICMMKSIKKLQFSLPRNETDMKRIVRELDCLEGIDTYDTERIGLGRIIRQIQYVLENGKRLNAVSYYIRRMNVADNEDAVIDGQALDAIEAIVRRRNVRLHVKIRLYNRNRDELSVREVCYLKFGILSFGEI